MCPPVQGICMIIGGIKHREQKFNSRSAGVSSALLFISVGGTCFIIHIFIVMKDLKHHKKHYSSAAAEMWCSSSAIVWMKFAV